MEAIAPITRRLTTTRATLSRPILDSFSCDTRLVTRCPLNNERGTSSHGHRVNIRRVCRSRCRVNEPRLSGFAVPRDGLLDGLWERKRPPRLQGLRVSLLAECRPRHCCRPFVPLLLRWQDGKSTRFSQPPGCSEQTRRPLRITCC